MATEDLEQATQPNDETGTLDTITEAALRQREQESLILANPLENILKVENLYKGTLIAAVVLFFVLLLFFFTLGDDLKIHMAAMMVLDVGLICAVALFYPALRDMIEADNGKDKANKDKSD